MNIDLTKVSYKDLNSKQKKSKSITSETEEQLKALLRLKEMGTLPEDIWKEKVKQLIS